MRKRVIDTSRYFIKLMTRGQLVAVDHAHIETDVNIYCAHPCSFSQFKEMRSRFKLTLTVGLNSGPLQYFGLINNCECRALQRASSCCATCLGILWDLPTF